MNKYLLLLWTITLLSFTFSTAQTPQSFTYQAVARDASGNVLASKNIGLRMTILSNTTAVYTETFNTATNAYGMFTVTLGTGTVVTGNFFTINWAQGSSSQKSLKVELDPAGGSAYVDMGSTTFNSVPYALVADKATNMTLDNLTDVNAASPGTNQVLQWNGSAWVAGNAGVQTNNTLSGDGSSANPLKLADQSAASGQVLQWNGSSWNPATISGGVGDNWGTQFVQKNVTLEGNGTGASPLKLAQQGAANGESLLWNGSVWGPGKPAISVDGVFTGQGTPANPLKLGQQGAANGDVLRWSGTTWVPGAPFSLPYFGSGTGAVGFATFSITNPSTSGNSRNAIDAIANGGTALNGISDPASGKAVSGKSDNGIGIYGTAGSNGLAGQFDGTVAVLGQLKVLGSQVLKSGDVYLADQPNSILSAPAAATTSVPGLDAVNFTVRNNSGVTVTTPARVIVNVNCPNYYAPNANAYIRFSITIKKGTSIIAGYDFYTSLTQNVASSMDFSRHFKLTEADDYTAILQINPSGSAVSASYFQMQLQVVYP